MSGVGNSNVQARDSLLNAVKELASALRQNPGNQRGWRDLFRVCYELDQLPAALSHALALISKVPFPEDVFFSIGRNLHYIGLHDAAVAIFEGIIAQQPDARLAHTELLVHKQLYGPEDDARREYERWNARFVTPLIRGEDAAATSPEPDRPLRIGFLSNDFAGDHSLNTVMTPWFMPKGQRRDTYILYSNCRYGYPAHQSFLDAADVFVDINALGDDALDERIRQDRIDILVDMISHGEHNRLLTYARKPAPIIVSWIGVGIATGVETVDYFLADEVMVPRESAELYREKIAYLPRAAMVWRPPASAPSVGPVPSVRRGHVIFGNLTRIVKFRQETIDLWARVLHCVPNSMFLLKDTLLRGGNARRVLAKFAACGIETERLILRAGTGHAEHLASYNDIDVVLDCFPQNGGISSLEALWMGVPVVTLSHPTKPSGRVGRYILENIGLPSLVADAADGYVGLAELLTQDRARLIPLRQNLRQRLSKSPLCDVASFQRHVATAFRHMWKRYCHGLPPESFTAADS